MLSGLLGSYQRVAERSALVFNAEVGIRGSEYSVQAAFPNISQQYPYLPLLRLEYWS
jgi:hypothetical protein